MAGKKSKNLIKWVIYWWDVYLKCVFYIGWLITLDVLKLIGLLGIIILMLMLINNIRCIEIFIKSGLLVWGISWLITLDVLKLIHLDKHLKNSDSWLITLDVLKYGLDVVYNDLDSTLINNIRCIEIKWELLRQALSSWVD